MPVIQLNGKLVGDYEFDRTHLGDSSPGGGGQDPELYGTWAESRNLYAHPFPPESIWNRPVGTGAVLVDAGLGVGNSWNPYGWPRGMVVQDEDHIGMDPTAPIKTVTATTSGATNIGVRVPATLAHDASGNGCAGFLTSANPEVIVQGQKLTLVAGGNPSWDFTIGPSGTGGDPYVNLRTDVDRSRAGSHGGSRMSSIGGTIRAGELDSADPIRHAMKMNLDSLRYLSQFDGGYRWPAYKADTGVSRYGTQGTPPNAMRMGVLLVLPVDFDTSWITQDKALKIANAMKHYGVYVVDQVRHDPLNDWHVYAFNMEESVWTTSEWPRGNTTATQLFHWELQELITNLYAVDNNAADQVVSGGGDPVASNLFAPATFTT